MAITSLRANCARDNVVKLPAAAPRKVQQYYNRAARAGKADLPRHPAEFLYPSQRRALNTAAHLMELGQSLTPEMELLTAICHALDAETRDRIVEALTPGVVAGRRTAAQALAVVQSTRMTVGETVDLDYAMRRLGGEA